MTKYTVEYKGFILNIAEVKDGDNLNFFDGECKEINFSCKELGYSGYFKLIGRFEHEVDNYISVKKEVDRLNCSNLIATFRAKAKKAHQKYHEAKRLNDTIFGVSLYQNLIEEMIETIEELAKEKENE